ncbi:ATP-binding protein [Fusobacterium mortiferum]|uniref:AAA family ATPase n=1 Tax=Fusobacterium mortiferum TaxID=850 RepID=UPI001F3AE2B5|nr:AAA family ATPase [Fusobacterium mortiferum]MCF2628977.1 ATP-binding protein [Fusobacterium mortiferum]
MIKQINIVQYRKLKNIQFDFSKGINIISGTNGTCKTSLLHIISNAFQAVPKSFEYLSDPKVLDTIKSLNKLNNPKIESLTRGDNEYNDPAPNIKGPLFRCEYFDETSLEFRKHNSPKNNRFSIKPKYPKDKKESLPIIPIIYLGLFRLYSFGEFNNDDEIKDINKKIPETYLEEIKELYKDFTGIEIKYKSQQDMGGIKNRAEFISDKEGVDSNTISAGEDNLFIILTALTSLKYYFESLNKENTNPVESILLIDEIDATLHPAFQIRLLDTFKEYSEKYKIQIIFTTHSISLLEYALSQKQKVIYLIDDLTRVTQMPSVDKYKIEMYLKNKAKKDIYLPKNIPVFTEDKEARIFLKELINYYKNKDKAFSQISGIFHFVDANLSCEALKNIFQDDQILRSTMRSICILDGDQAPDPYTFKANLANHIITLPENAPPEVIFFEYSKFLYENDISEFWNNSDVQEQGFTKIYYRTNIKSEIDNIDKKISESNHLRKRDENKRIFKDYQLFFNFVIRHWLHDPKNQDKIATFFKNLNILFKKVAAFHGINPNDWNII